MTTNESTNPPVRKSYINDKAQKEITDALKVGCSLDTCAALIGVPTWRITNKIKRSNKFRRELEKAAAEFERDRMKSVNAATEDSKNWRATTWLLEHRAVHHFRKRPADAIHKDQLQPILDAFAQILVSVLPDDATREAALAQFDKAITQLCGPPQPELPPPEA